MKTGSVRWRDGSLYVGANDLGLEVPLQGPPGEGQPRVAPSPKDLVLLGLGGCTAVDVMEILRKMRQPVGSFRVDLEAEESDEHPRVFTRVRLIYRLEGHGLDPQRVIRAVTLSQQKYCGVSAMIRRTAAVHYAVEVNGEKVFEEALS